MINSIPDRIEKAQSNFCLLSLNEQLHNAYNYAINKKQLNFNLFPYQLFQMNMQEVFNAAIYGKTQENTIEKLLKAYKHLSFFNLQKEALWPYLPFSITIYDLISSCLTKLNVDLNILKDIDNNVKKIKDDYAKTIRESKKALEPLILI